METTSSEKPKLLVRSKNIQLVFDYCLENKLKFNVSPRLNNDEWEIELIISEIMDAIALGVFVKESKIEVIGLAKSHGIEVKSKKAAKNNTTGKKQELTLNEVSENEEETSSIEMDENKSDDVNVNDSELAF